MNVRTRLTIALAPIAAIVFTTACGHDEPHRTGADLEALNVEVVKVERLTGPRPIDVRGTVQAARQATVSSRVMGPVVALKVRAEPAKASSHRLRALSRKPMRPCRWPNATTSDTRLSMRKRPLPISSSTWPRCSSNRPAER